MNDHDPVVPAEIEAQANGFPNQPENAPAPEENHPLHRLHILFRGRYHWAALLGIVGAIVGAVGGYELVEPVYMSRGIIEIAERKQKILYDTPDNNPLLNADAFVHEQAELIRTRRVVESALESDDWKKAVAKRVDPLPLEEFYSNLNISDSQGDNEITVSYTDRDPKVATAATQAVIAAYLELADEQDTEHGTKRLEILQGQVRLLDADINEVGKDIAAVTDKYGTNNLDDVYRAKMQDVNQFAEQWQTLQLQLATTPIAGNGQAGQSPGGLTAEDVAVGDPQMRQYLDIRQKIQDQIADLEVHFGPQYRDVVEAQTQLDHVNDQIKQLLGQYQQAPAGGSTANPSIAAAPADNSGLALRARAQRIKELYDSAYQDALDIGKKNVWLKSKQEILQDDKVKLKETQDAIDHNNVESEVGGRIHVTNPGEEPLGPSNGKNRIQLATLGALGLGGLGVGIIGLMGYRDRSMQTIDDARTSLTNIPMLGILPRLPANLDDPHQAAMAAHCVHQIRTLVQIGTRRARHQVIAITSPAAETGKTSLTLALGLSFAASGSRTLIIDTDLVGRGLSSRTGVFARERLGQVLLRHELINPTQLEDALAESAVISQYLGKVLVDRGLISEQQLAEALAEQEKTSLGILDACNGTSFDLCTTQLNGKQLHILPVGRAVGSQAVSLSPAAISQLIAQARVRFDIVLLDTGPVPGSLEGSMVAAAADGVVLVVSRGDQRPQAAAATAHLRSVGARIAGLVFNRADVEDIARSVYMSASRQQVDRSKNDFAREVPTPSESTSPHFGPIASAVATFAPQQEGQNHQPEAQTDHRPALPAPPGSPTRVG